MAGRLKDKVVIVTGAGRGIGEATARAMAAEGAAIVVAEKDALSGKSVAASLVEAGARALFVETDVADIASCKAMAEQALATFGRIDVLVANAGINVFHEPLETTEEEWRRCFAVDLDGVWYSARAVLPAMRAQTQGSIVAIASCHSFAIIPSTFPYPVAKHG
ncbi:MAG: SDR family NAD(P)-dependent oxidoreductase, partial [Mesorhizobium sp.]